MTSDRTRPKEPPIRLRIPTNLATAITSVTALGLAASGVAPVAAQDSHSRPAVIRSQDLWYLNDELAGGAAETSYTYGSQDTIHVMGDWDGDGVSTPGVIRPAGDVDAEGEVALDWYLRNSNTPGPADEVVTFGHADNREDFDTPVVGDWDGDGRDTVGVVIPDYDTNEFVWKLANDHANATVDVEFRYGEPHAYGTLQPEEYREVPIVGDWDGDGVDGPGVVQQDPQEGPNLWELRDDPSAGPADHVFSYGRTDDRLVTGDWDGDGRDTPGVIRPPHWYVTNDLDGGVADEHIAYGRATDEPIVWETTTTS